MISERTIKIPGPRLCIETRGPLGSLFLSVWGSRDETWYSIRKSLYSSKQVLCVKVPCNFYVRENEVHCVGR